jgi:ADP-ribosylglycohydrolase
VTEGFELPFSELTPHSRIRGCLLGGAVGDAIGAPVEFLSLQQIRHRFGTDGIRDYAPAYGRRGAITDDTQLTLFTAEGPDAWRHSVPASLPTAQEIKRRGGSFRPGSRPTMLRW